MRTSAALSTLRQIACLGYDARTVLPTLIETLRSVAHFEISSCVFVDAQYRPTDSYHGTIRRYDVEALYLSKYFERLESKAMPSSGDLLRSAQDYDSTRAYGSRYFNSDFYDVICRPVNLHHGLRLAIRDGRRPIACMVLSRPRGDRPFLTRDEDNLLRARPYLCHALARISQEHEATMTPSEESGIVISTPQGDIQHMSAEADCLLRMAVPPRHPGANNDYYQNVRDLLRPLALRLAERDTHRQTAPALQVKSAWGRFSLRGYWLSPHPAGAPALVAIQITRYLPLPLRLLGLDAVRALPAKEKETCLLLAQGRSTTQIATVLQRSTHTVVSQVRSIYQRFNVSSRTELIDQLLGHATPASHG